MSKVIYEFEKPKCCKECVWYQADEWFGGVCVIAKDENGWSKDIGADEEYDVQKWCPLVPKAKAIPVDWLKERYLDFKHPKWSFMLAEAVTLILKDWEKENAL